MLEPADRSRFARQLAAMVKRAGDDDPEAFAEIVRLLDNARGAMPEAATRLREQGYSYTDLGRAVGIHRVSARERFHPSKVRPRRAAMTT